MHTAISVTSQCISCVQHPLCWFKPISAHPGVADKTILHVTQPLYEQSRTWLVSFWTWSFGKCTTSSLRLFFAQFAIAHAQKRLYNYFWCQIWSPICVLRAQFSTWREILEIGRFQVFLVNFLLWNGHHSTSDQIFNPEFEIPMGCFVSVYKFWWHFRFECKMAFVMQNFQSLGIVEVGVKILSWNP